MTTWWYLTGFPLMQAYLGIASCNAFSNHNIYIYIWWCNHLMGFQLLQAYLGIASCDLFSIFLQIMHFSNVLKWRYAWHLCCSSSHVLHLFASSKLLDINHSKWRGSFITESWLFLFLSLMESMGYKRCKHKHSSMLWTANFYKQKNPRLKGQLHS